MGFYSVDTIIRAAKRAEMHDIVDLWSEVFGVETAFFRSLLEAEPLRPTGHTRVAVDPKGRILSTVQIFTRQKRGRGRSVHRVGGIGSVATRPDARGQGLATRLMEDAVRLMREEGFAYSLLFTGINDFYAPMGFRTVKNGRAVGRIASGPILKRMEWIRPETQIPARALAAMRRAYTYVHAERPLSDPRNLREWRTAVAYRLAGRYYDLYLHQGNLRDPLAYCSVRWGADTLEVNEWGYEAGGEKFVGEIFDTLRSEAVSRQIREILVGPAIAPREEALLGRLVTDLRPSDEASTMVLPISMSEEDVLALFYHPLARCLHADGF